MCIAQPKSARLIRAMQERERLPVQRTDGKVAIGILTVASRTL